MFFFSIWVFFHEHSRITGLQEKRESISFNYHFHFHPLHRHLDIIQAITAESSPLHIASSQARTSYFQLCIILQGTIIIICSSKSSWLSKKPNIVKYITTNFWNDNLKSDLYHNFWNDNIGKDLYHIVKAMHQPYINPLYQII